MVLFSSLHRGPADDNAIAIDSQGMKFGGYHAGKIGGLIADGFSVLRLLWLRAQ
jgi:hypothetical protein